MPQVLFFFGASRWTECKRMKQNKVLLQNCDVVEFHQFDDIRCESKGCSIATWMKTKRVNKLSKIYNWSDFL